MFFKSIRSIPWLTICDKLLFLFYLGRNSSDLFVVDSNLEFIRETGHVINVRFVVLGDLGVL